MGEDHHTAPTNDVILHDLNDLVRFPEDAHLWTVRGIHGGTVTHLDNQWGEQRHPAEAEAQTLVAATPWQELAAAFPLSVRVTPLVGNPAMSYLDGRILDRHRDPSPRLPWLPCAALHASRTLTWRGHGESDMERTLRVCVIRSGWQWWASGDADHAGAGVQDGSRFEATAHAQTPALALARALCLALEVQHRANARC